MFTNLQHGAQEVCQAERKLYTDEPLIDEVCDYHEHNLPANGQH